MGQAPSNDHGTILNGEVSFSQFFPPLNLADVGIKQGGRIWWD